MRRIKQLLLISFLSACVTPLDFEVAEPEKTIVVDGFISDLPGPHLIQITYMAPFRRVSDGGTVYPVKGADVEVISESGSRIQLIEIRDGRYETPPVFQGIAGDKYQLRIVTADGVQIESAFHELVKGPELDTVFTRFKKLPSSDEYDFRSGIEVIAQWKDPAGERNFHLWTRHQGIYKIITSPPSPPPNCCAICWITDVSDQINVHEDLRQDGELIKETALFIEDDGRRFRERYWVELQHLTITPEAYEFYKTLKSQLDIEGSIFDPPVAEIKGNLQVSNDENVAVLGYFGAFGAQKKSFYINRELIEERQPEYIIYDFCQFLLNSNPVKPTFWKDADED